MIELREDEAALERIDGAAIEKLTRTATQATFYIDGLSAEQLAANRRNVAISADTPLGSFASIRRSRRIMSCRTQPCGGCP